MQTLLRRIIAGIGTGAALAASGIGCASSVQRPGDNADSDANRVAIDAADNLRSADATIDAMVMVRSDASAMERLDASTLRDANVDANVSAVLDASGSRRDATAEVLPPFPLTLGCTEEDAGWCCYGVFCYAVDGSCPAADAPENPASSFTSPPYYAHCDRLGPFGPNPEYLYAVWPDADGDCCYAVPAEPLGAGRPFIADGIDHVAPVILRDDWLFG
jgi:hypothetical protein